MKILVVMLLGSLCFYVGCAVAANDGMCQYYAQTAVSENNRNQRLSCRLTGPRWDSNPANHVGWCSGAKLESITNEAIGRLMQLNGCNHSEGMCEQYVQDALAANELNKRLQCRFSGPRYESTPQGHKSWCLGAKTESVADEIRGRYGDIDRCTTCDHYAAEAIRYNELSKARGCKFSGPRWSSEREGHFRWCMGARLSSVVQEQNKRAAEAVNCH
ncbi:hypothetical protein [Burkholderia ubonensis]|uniref:hypothetical protein n=1 Tax=Burkholderia ubonensis TaxID=101571 RepID=UPI0005DA50E8|nr:hypothetical protein [Burkholderia ubonensis]AJX15588.1 hypothetical protein BW23_2889 [Burkholderia ubonensis MSMB22]